MPSFEELARDYAGRLASTSYTQAVAGEIAQEIKSLVYPSGYPVNVEDRKRILEKTYEYLTNYPYYTKSADNYHYLQLLNWILSQVS
jgi:hypothetical protein